VNSRAADGLKAAHRREMTHCKYGHSLADAYVRPNSRYLSDRECLTCKLNRARLGEVMKPEVLQKVQVRLHRGASIGSMTKPGQPGYLLAHATFNRYRRENTDFDKLVADVMKGSNSRGQQRRRQRAKSQATREQANDYHKVRAMVPAYLPDHVRDDITQNIMIGILEGSLRRDDVRQRVALFVTEHNRMFPTKYAMRSLDAPAYQEGPTSLIETISEDLWDRHWHDDDGLDEYG
jgi:hypothetical protein